MDASLVGAIVISIMTVGVLVAVGGCVWFVFKYVRRARNIQEQPEDSTYDDAELANIQAKILQNRQTAQDAARKLRVMIDFSNQGLDADSVNELRSISTNIDLIAKHNEAIEAAIDRGLYH